MRTVSTLAAACAALLVSACNDSSPTGSSVTAAIACPPAIGAADLTGYSVTPVTSTYATAGAAGGFFSTGQAADVMLSGLGFDNTGGALLFNHPRSLASDGTRLALSDGNNNRVLIWNVAPTASTPPDLVLGQPDFTHNAPGSGLAQMRWPGQVAFTPDGKLLVADSYNDRVLVWLTVPTASGAPADFAITHSSLRWPWGVWSDGTRLVVSSTGSARVLVWAAFPASGFVAPSFQITGSGIGTPRTVTSNGTALIVGDHNANGSSVGNWFWTTFPTSAASAPQFFRSDPTDANAAWMQGTYHADGRLLLLGGRSLNVWNTTPTSATTAPNLIVTGYQFSGGDGGAVAVAGGRTYVVEYNGNRIAAYSDVPSTASRVPDFAIGSPSLTTNTLLANYFITNAVPAVAGGRLYVSSDFDRKLSVWNTRPGTSGAWPNWVYTLPFSPWDNAATDTMFALAGQKTVAIWKGPPANGSLPDIVLRNTAGSVALQSVMGVAIDSKYFYLADFGANKVYAWRGVPTGTCAPAVTLDVPSPGRISSDGTWFAITPRANPPVVRLYRVSDLATTAAYASVGGSPMFNLPEDAQVSRGSLFVASTPNNVVHVWRDAATAATGLPAEIILGAASATPVPPPTIGASTFFWPGAVAWDGSYLWVGEFKFSNRVLRFTAH
ncbi:MAG: hypothetical protein FJ207_14975 [Gemmatimonadetes bacterium]|nr:hypothetical protein [Gemmatimonadota bacterium]